MTHLEIDTHIREYVAYPKQIECVGLLIAFFLTTDKHFLEVVWPSLIKSLLA